MNNSTGNKSEFNENVFRSPELVGFLMELIASIVCCYVLTTLAIILIRNRRQSEHQRASKFRLVLMLLFVSFGVTVFAKSVMGVVFYVTHRDTTGCLAVDTAHQAVHTIGGGLLFVFLWMRQYTLYRNRFLKRLATKHINRFSFSLLGVMLALLTIALFGVYFTSLSVDVIAVGQRCLYVDNTYSVDLLAAGFHAIGILAQGGVLALFVFLLRQHENMAEEVIRTRGRSNLSALERLRVVVRTCFISAAVSVATDIICVALTTVLRHRVSMLVTNAIWDFDSLINFICALVCFNNWKDMLRPFKSTKKKTISRRPEVYVLTK